MTPDRIRACRKQAGLTQKQLGNLLGVAQTTIAGWENGSRSVTIDVIDNIARALNIPVSSLLHEETFNKASKDFNQMKADPLFSKIADDDKHLRSIAYDGVIEDEFFDAMFDAEVLIRHKAAEATKDVPDNYILRAVTRMFNDMNRSGKYELYRYALLLINSGEYNKEQ